MVKATENARPLMHWCSGRRRCWFRRRWRRHCWHGRLTGLVLVLDAAAAAGMSTRNRIKSDFIFYLQNTIQATAHPTLFFDIYNVFDGFWSSWGCWFQIRCRPDCRCWAFFSTAKNPRWPTYVDYARDTGTAQTSLLYHLRVARTFALRANNYK